MYTVVIPEMEFFDEKNDIFIKTKSSIFQIEHSLISLSKWESKWKKPFLDSKDKTADELIDYIKCMTLTKNVDDSVYKMIPNNVLKEINDYIEHPMTATWFSDDKKKNRKRSREIVTSEIIYYWMITLNIPFECQKWHLNRLLTLIRVCSLKNAPAKKMNRKDILKSNAKLNAARRASMNSKG